MKVTRILATSLLLAVGVFAATNAHAVGALRLSWNSCDYVQNLNFTGPGQQAKMVVSVSGEDRPMRGSRVFISIGNGVQDAWRFDAAGCNSVSAIVYSLAAFSKACGQAVGTNPIPINQYLYDPGTGKALLDMAVAHDPKTLAAASRYALFQATFDHTYSNVGPTNADYCGGAEFPLCCHIVGAEFLNDQFVKEGYNIENDFVTWNDPANDGGCPGATQARESSWGRVKGLYR